MEISDYANLVLNANFSGIALWCFPTNTRDLLSDVSAGSSRLAEAVEFGFEDQEPFYFSWKQTGDDLHLGVSRRFVWDRYGLDRLCVTSADVWPRRDLAKLVGLRCFTHASVQSGLVVAVCQIFTWADGSETNVWVASGVCFNDIGESVFVGLLPPNAEERLILLSSLSFGGGRGRAQTPFYNEDD